ncbi:hypothetical protein ACM66B_003704 [Microbotryomycetes sp. NB124-2]
MNVHHQKSSYRHSVVDTPLRSLQGTLKQASAVDNLLDNAPKLASRLVRVPFAWQLDLTVPSNNVTGAQRLPLELETMISDISSFYVCKNVNLADLLEPQFMNEHVRKGSLVALSMDASEGADVVALDGRGRLVMNVSKDTYEQLGLPGRRSAYGVKGQRFVIEILLSDMDMRSGKAGFEKVRNALRDWPRQTATGLWSELAGVARPEPVRGRTFDLSMTFVDDEGRPAPIQVPNSVAQTHQTTELVCEALADVKVPESIFKPIEQARKRRRLDDSASVSSEVQEWLGLVACRADHHLKWDPDGDDDVQRPWSVPQDECERGSVLFASWTGFFHPKLVAKIVSIIVSSSVDMGAPFVNLHLQQPPHSPLSHLSKASPQVVNTSRKPNGGKQRQGRGRGEDEEAEPPSSLVRSDGWQILFAQTGEGSLGWTMLDSP